MLHDLDVADDFALYSTQWLQRMLILASHSILKITRSELRTHMDLEHGEKAYFKAIMFSKKRSAENNDLDSRNAIILTQLWASDSIFRKKDGILIGDRLRMRSRLVSAENLEDTAN
jgi:transcriptional regulatory protein LEU3